MEETEFAVGDRVTLVADTPEGRPVKGEVVVVNDAEENPGKQVGVKLDDYVAGGHGLDGLVDEREQGDGQMVIGNGWWARPENLVKDEA